MHIAEWISVEHRKEVHEKIQGQVRDLLWNRAQIEEGEMEEQFNKEAKEGWIFAANAARITEETESSESTATWERLWEQKKGRLSRFQEMKEESPERG